MFWEVSLVPMYFLIGIWGHERRIYAAVKFFLYTMAGSVLMLAAIIYLYNQTRHVQLPDDARDARQRPADVRAGRADAAVPGVLPRVRDQGAAVPAAHLAAGRARGSAHRRFRHAGRVMLKMGTYGILRFCLPLFPNAARENARLDRRARDHRHHLRRAGRDGAAEYEEAGGVLLGEPPRLRRARDLLVHPAGADGAVYQMLNHGISTGALFMLVGYLYERRHSLEIEDYGGVATPAPWLSTVFLITTLASIGLPTLSNFVGEFLVLQGAAHGELHLGRLRRRSA